MINALNIAVSGLNAQQNRVGYNANNTVNQATSSRVPEGTTRAQQNENYDGYRPVRSAPTSVGEGNGVRSGGNLVDPSFVLAFSPDDSNANADGVVAKPNVDLATERVDTIAASKAFSANLAAIRTADEMAGTLLDITE